MCTWPSAEPLLCFAPFLFPFICWLAILIIIIYPVDTKLGMNTKDKSHAPTTIPYSIVTAVAMSSINPPPPPPPMTTMIFFCVPISSGIVLNAPTSGMDNALFCSFFNNDGINQIVCADGFSRQCGGFIPTSLHIPVSQID